MNYSVGEAGKKLNYSVRDAVNLVNKIIVNGVAVDDFYGLMHLYQKRLINKKQIYSEFCVLFRDHPDILGELQRLIFMEEEQNMAEPQQNLRKEERVCAAFVASDGFTKRVENERKRDRDHDQGTNNDFRFGVCYSEGINLFNRAREKLCNVDGYCRFLKVVHMHSKGKINGGELETKVAGLLQNDTDLIKEFAGFKRLCERDFDHGSVAWGASNKPQQLEEEKELRKTGRAGGEKRAKAPIINGFNPKRCTPSYRPRLMDEFPAPVVVANTSKEAPILNDYWVCEPCPGIRFPSRKEIASPQNEYEDDRYILDMALASLKSAIDNAEKLQNHIQGISNELLLETPIRLENFFTASNIKLLSKELDGLRRKPAVKLPFVLARLNQKKEEVLEAINGMRVGFMSRRSGVLLKQFKRRIY